jgi:Protein of unknown function DUF262
MNNIDLNIKINNEEDLLLRIYIDDTRAEEGIILFDMFDVKEGIKVISYQFENDNLTILDNPTNIDINLAEIKEKFEELLVQNNPKQIFGTENTELEDDPEKEEDEPYDPEKIRVDTKQLSLRHIFDMIELKDIDLTPDFQRNLVWDESKKSRLIESILLRIPLPIFYFAQDIDGKISVVDGLQRLSTIHKFMKNEFKLNNLEYLQEKCKNKFYTNPDPNKAIDAKYYRWLNLSNITVNIIDPSSPFKLKYDIFKRINTGGLPLNSQEIRNCLSSNNLRVALKLMIKNDNFKKATGWSIKDVRMEAQELALRFILFHKKYQIDKSLQNYTGNIDSELNTLTEMLSKDKNFNFKYYIELFDNAMKNAFYLFGKYSFRKSQLKDIQPDSRRQLINKVLFVSCSVLLSEINHDNVVKKNAREKLVEPLASKITNDKTVFERLTWGTNARSNHQTIFKTIEDIIKENLNI